MANGLLPAKKVDYVLWWSTVSLGISRPPNETRPSAAVINVPDPDLCRIDVVRFFIAVK